MECFRRGHQKGDVRRKYMAINLVLGRARDGKSAKVYKKIIEKSLENPDKSYFVIVPEQFTMQTQLELVQLHPNKGISNIDVLSFMRLAYRVFQQQGGMQKIVLEDTGKSMLVRRVIEEKQEQLKVFKNYAKKPGYVSEIKSLLSEFYQYEIKEEKMKEMLAVAKDNQPMLQRKLEDMQVVYEGFEELLAEKYITAEEILDVLTERLEQYDVLKNTTIVLDGYTGFTPVQYKLLRKLMKLCEEIIVTITIDPFEKETYQKQEFSLFHLSRETVNKLKRIAEEEGVPCKESKIKEWKEEGSSYLACLEENLYRFSVQPYEAYCKRKGVKQEKEQDIAFFAARTMEGEVSYAIREIKHLIQKKGYRYRDIAIVTGDMEQYGRLLEKACREEKIPCFIDYKKDILGNPLVEFLRTVLQLFVRNFDYESVFRYLRCGLADMDLEQVDILENYVLAMGIKGYSRWNKEWDRIFEKDCREEEEKKNKLEGYNALRVQFISSFENLRTVFSKREQTIRQYVTALHAFMLERGIYQKLKAYERKFEEQGEQMLAKEYAQVYELVLGIFDKLVELLGDETVTVAELGDLLETGYTEVKVGLIPPGVDQVLVGDVERTRLKEIKALFFLGVNEGIVPKNSSSGGLLSDMEREMLAQNQIALAPTARETVYTQQFYFYLNLTKPQNKLYLTYHKVNEEGKPALASSLLRQVQKIVPNVEEKTEKTVDVTENITIEQMERVLGNSMGKAYLLDGIRKIGVEEFADWWKELLSFHIKSAKEDAKTWKHWEQILDGLAFQNTEDNLSRQVAEALYGKRLKNSVTRIEKYAACAYAHFLQYGLRLQERQEFQFKSVDFGNIFHEVLRRLPKALETKNLGWRTAEETELYEAVDLCMKQLVEEYGNSILLSSEKNIYMVARMTRILKRTVWALAQQLKEGAFEPTGYEIKFDFSDGLDSARMDLGDEHTMRLSGQIDRLDALQDGDKVLLKVIDYKSGIMTFSLSNLYYGLQMQLVVYMNAAAEFTKDKYPEKEIETAGIFYYNMDDPIVTKDEEEAVNQALLKALKMNGLVNRDSHVIPLLDQAFAAGEEQKDTLKGSVKSWIIPVETVKDGGIGKRSSVMDKKGFETIGAYVKHKISKEGKEIFDGNIQIEPYRQKDRTACAYCPYLPICGFDPKLPGNAYREFQELKAEDAVAQMQKELNGEKQADGGNTHGE